jgi:hypothetical protein
VRISQELSMRALRATRPDEIEQWLTDVDRYVGGLRWVPLGGIENNVHTVQVSADPRSRWWSGRSTASMLYST